MKIFRYVEQSDTFAVTDTYLRIAETLGLWTEYGEIP